MVKTERLLGIFIFLHVAVWTLAPALMRFNLPLDTIEGTIWGSHLSFGYDKNPYLSAWLNSLAIQLESTSGLMTYLMSQLSVGVAFIAIFLLARKILPSFYALLSVLILEGVQYFHFHAIDFSDNVLELSMWSLTILFFYEAITENKLRDWLSLGLFASLSVMTKYYSALLIISLFLFLCWNKDARQFFAKKQLYLSVLLSFLIIFPHILWLFSHDFTTIHYAFARVHTKPLWMHHLSFPFQFTLEQLATIFPAFFLLLLLYIGKKPFTEKISVSQFQKEFLFFAGIMPFILTLLISFFMGYQLRAAWGQPLLSLWGILFILLLKPRVSEIKIKNTMILICFSMVLLVCVYCMMQINTKKASSANFRGREIAETITTKWRETYGNNLKFVAGPRWIAGNIAFYSKDHPSVYIDWDNKLSPWIDETELLKNGGIFVWDLSEFRYQAKFTYEEIKNRYPEISAPEILHFSWHRNNALTPYKIMIAFMPPK